MGFSIQGGHTAFVTPVAQRGAQRTCRKAICALTAGLVAAFKCEMPKLDLSVAVLLVSSNVCDSSFVSSLALH